VRRTRNGRNPELSGRRDANDGNCTVGGRWRWTVAVEGGRWPPTQVAARPAGPKGGSLTLPRTRVTRNAQIGLESDVLSWHDIVPRFESAATVSSVRDGGIGPACS
jgi:hypothetical protein